ncbi:transporter substrate-binding domain-containing protein [Ancylobacter lacus]|uniref:transporter substrate-binding domain-containing protein n=1 Tax=Ancylobacter lacus TaxID=2579970 RepID=UPI001BD16CCF|nr:transporter substrate-binding domain-containing protein [Ancylobacter lacus]MBS7541229.1 transporter substrate-binding domain-containing protein [Ancylobacter lacus]
MVTPLRIGILYSTQGPYGAMGRDCHDGAALAIEHLAAAGIAVEPVYADPGGEGPRYVTLARELLRERGCRHIVGTILSAGRKDVIPLVEKHDGLLWYVCPYEGFEANESVIYTGACPNQHLLPLFEYLIPRHGGRAFLLGANYVWGWEMNRLARELLLAGGGEVVGERFLPIDETEIERLVAEIEAQRPSFILNNLIGPSSYAFLAAMSRLAARDPAFRPEVCPVVSCDLTECELGEIEPGVAVGQLAAACYFDSLDTAENRAFKADIAARWGRERRASTFFAAAHAAVDLCARAIVAAGTDEPGAVRQALLGRPHATVQGTIRIDPRTNHAALPFHLGRINAEGGFDIVASRPAIAADPYLTGLRDGRARPHLRVVS